MQIDLPQRMAAVDEEPAVWLQRGLDAHQCQSASFWMTAIERSNPHGKCHVNEIIAFAQGQV
jgi:hypothetical protein